LDVSLQNNEKDFAMAAMRAEVAEEKERMMTAMRAEVAEEKERMMATMRAAALLDVIDGRMRKLHIELMDDFAAQGFE
jgi:hypothetical protein